MGQPEKTCRRYGTTRLTSTAAVHLDIQHRRSVPQAEIGDSLPRSRSQTATVLGRLVCIDYCRSSLLIERSPVIGTPTCPGAPMERRLPIGSPGRMAWLISLVLRLLLQELLDAVVGPASVARAYE